MATVLRNIHPLAPVMATAINSLKAQIGAGANFHLDAGEEAISSPTATDLPTSLALVNNLIGVMTFHFADLLAHKAADATSLPAVGAAVDLASAQTAINLCRTSWGTHIASTAKHYNADATNTIVGTPAATDLPSLQTLANAFATVFAAHIASAPAGKSIRLVGC